MGATALMTSTNSPRERITRRRRERQKLIKINKQGCFCAYFVYGLEDYATYATPFFHPEIFTLEEIRDMRAAQSFEERRASNLWLPERTRSQLS